MAVDNRLKVLQQADKLFKQGKVEAAIKEYQKIVEVKPDDIEVRRIIGDLYLKLNKLPEAFKQFETIIRWSQWDAAADFIAPEFMAENPITRLEMDRLRLFRVTAYTVRSTGVFDEGLTARQVVEIKLFNANQAVERTIIHEQEWRYHEDVKRWLLHSRLPDPTQRL